MAAINLSTDSGFNYYAPIQVQNSIVKRKTKIFSPINALQDGTPFEFLAIAGGSESGIYMDLANSKFYFTIQVLTSANANPVAAEHLSCLNNLAHSMFSKIQVFLGDKEIGDSNSLYPFRAYIAHLLYRSKQAQETWMTRQGWYSRDLVTKWTAGETTANDAVKARNLAMGLAQEVELEMHPELDIFNSDKYMPSGLPIRIRFTPAQNTFVLKRGALNLLYKLKITDAKFHCSTVYATGAQHLACLKAVREHGPMRIYMTHTTVKHHTISAQKQTTELENIYNGPIPNRITMVMIRDEALAGSYALNAFNFQHFDVNEIGLLVNGEPVPSQFYTPDFTNKRYIKEYTGILEALDSAYSIHTIPLTAAEWGDGFTIFAFDLTPDKNNGRTHSPQGQGNVRLGLKFRVALPNSIALILLAEYDSWVEIDQYFNVTSAFQ